MSSARLGTVFASLARWRPQRRHALFLAFCTTIAALAAFGAMVSPLLDRPVPRLPPPSEAPVAALPEPTRYDMRRFAPLLAARSVIEAPPSLAGGWENHAGMGLAPALYGPWIRPVSAMRRLAPTAAPRRLRRLAITRASLAKISLDVEAAGPYALIVYFDKDRVDAGMAVLDCWFGRPERARIFREGFIADLSRDILDKAWFATRTMPAGVNAFSCTLLP